MSWIRKALTITTVHADSYYTSIDPGEFYEWRFRGEIPKGKVFTKRLPPSSIFTDGMLIATARIPQDALDKREFGFETNQVVTADIMLQAGQIQSPHELINRYKRIQSEFASGVDRFKATAQVRSYFAADGNLYRISPDNDRVQLQHYGDIKEILNTLTEIRKSLSQTSMTKKGRAHEMEEFRRFENAMTFVQNDQVPVDSGKIDTLFRIAEINPSQTTVTSWPECYVRVSPDASTIKELLDRYDSLSWVQASTRLNLS